MRGRVPPSAPVPPVDIHEARIRALDTARSTSVRRLGGERSRPLRSRDYRWLDAVTA